MGEYWMREMGSQSMATFNLLLRVHAVQAWRRLLAIRDQSRLLTSLILVFLAGYTVLSFWLFWKGLRFLSNFPGLGGLLAERLLFLLFAFLFVLLWLSNLVISYTNLFRNRETYFLLAAPVSRQTIFQWKFVESALLASWAFLFLIAPLLAAYGLANHVVWHFYLVTPILILLFIILPAVGGSWSAVCLASYLDRRSFQLAALVGGLSLLIAAAVLLKPAAVTDEMIETRVLDVLDRLLVKTRFSQFPLLPSYWLAACVLNWSEGALATAGFFILVLLSYVLLFGFLTLSANGSFFYQAISAVQSRGSVLARWEWVTRLRRDRRLREYRVGLIEKLFFRFPGLRLDVRALLVKDARMFWRDTAQWGQTIVLFGLLGVYIINLRHFTRQMSNPFWIHLVSYLNLMACALNLATLTTRFVYPQFSLEGKRLWIMGIAPMGLERMLWVKFWLAFAASLLITVGLTILSCWMLQMSWFRTLYFISAITIMTFALNGMAVGLGALYPNFKEDNPSKIVSGFGGTFCLVLSFVYIVASVAGLATGSAFGSAGGGRHWIVLSWLAFALWSFFLAWLPLRWGLRRLSVIEF